LLVKNVSHAVDAQLRNGAQLGAFDSEAQGLNLAPHGTFCGNGGDALAA
jgi:hypothetical protein